MYLGRFSVKLINCVQGPNESLFIFSWAAQLCAWYQWIWAHFLWATQLCTWTHWICAHFLLGYTAVCMDPLNLCNTVLSYSTVCMDPMNVGTFSVTARLLNCVHGPNECGHISCWATQLCTWTQWICAISCLAKQLCAWIQLIWAHFLIGCSTNESGHIFCGLKLRSHEQSLCATFRTPCSFCWQISVGL